MSDRTVDRDRRRVIAVVVIGAALPQSPLDPAHGFAPLPLRFFAVVVAFVVGDLVSVEIAKYLFFGCTRHRRGATPPSSPRAPGPPHRVAVEPPPPAARRPMTARCRNDG